MREVFFICNNDCHLDAKKQVEANGDTVVNLDSHGYVIAKKNPQPGNHVLYTPGWATRFNAKVDDRVAKKHSLPEYTFEKKPKKVFVIGGRPGTRYIEAKDDIESNGDIAVNMNEDGYIITNTEPEAGNYIIRYPSWQNYQRRRKSNQIALDLNLPEYGMPEPDDEPDEPQPTNPNKRYPAVTGCVDYFPDAVKAVGNCSLVGNEQHNPGEPLHWDKSKSSDHADALVRHLIKRGTTDDDGVRHTAKVAWRALALLQEEIENDM